MNSKFLSALLLCATPLLAQEVHMKSVTEKIPTYQIGAPEIDPIFFTGRVYQGAEGYIYPYPLYDILTEKKIEKDYNVLRLNNQYVDIAILPEIGGRIFAASDKTNDYPFFYTQTGIKPALIGMLGAWLSGGVEWNIPDHHRASSYMPINWTMKENEDGSKTIWVGETELRHRLKWSIGIHHLMTKRVPDEKSPALTLYKASKCMKRKREKLSLKSKQKRKCIAYRLIFPYDKESSAYSDQ